MARLTARGLLISHGYYCFLSALRGWNVDYLWWYGATVGGPNPADYVISLKGFQDFYPGTHFYDHYATAEADFAAGKYAYDLVARAPGPEPAQIIIYRRRLDPAAATP